MGDFDAYQPPKAPTDMPPPGDPVAACFNCKNTTATKVRFTWWGGALGPKLFNVVKCARCGKTFNGKTGASLTNVIIVYQAIAFAVAIVIFWVLIGMRR
jgi:hypothetical protein